MLNVSLCARVCVSASASASSVIVFAALFILGWRKFRHET